MGVSIPNKNIGPCSRRRRRRHYRIRLPRHPLKCRPESRRRTRRRRRRRTRRPSRAFALPTVPPAPRWVRRRHGRRIPRFVHRDRAGGPDTSAAAATPVVAVSSAGAALGGVACQRAVEDRQRALVEDRASHAGAPAAARATMVASAGEPLGNAAAERQALQGQVAGRIDIEEAERRRADASDRDAQGQSGLAVDNQRVAVADKKGRRAGHRRAGRQIVDEGGQADGPAVDYWVELDGVVAGAADAVAVRLTLASDRFLATIPRAPLSVVLSRLETMRVASASRSSSNVHAARHRRRDGCRGLPRREARETCTRGPNALRSDCLKFIAGSPRAWKVPGTPGQHDVAAPVRDPAPRPARRTNRRSRAAGR